MNTYKGHRVISDAEASENHEGIKALYPGVCTHCHGPIKVGELIGKTPVGGWEHVLCPARTEVRPWQPGEVRSAANLTEAPAGLPNGIWTIEGPRGHRTYRISTIIAPKDQPEVSLPVPEGQSKPFRQRFAGRRVLELLTGPDNTSSYRGLAWYDGKIGKLWKLGQGLEVLVNTFAKLVERGEPLEGYTVHFARNCYKCNRLLTTPESIERGIGPICASGGWDR